jgi:LPXTG-motif cell wall-anchored protein
VPPTISQIGTTGGTQDSTAAPGGTTAGKPVPQEPGSKLNIWYILAPAGVLVLLLILLLVWKKRKQK